MKGSLKAQNVIKSFGTNNVFAIAEKSGVEIVYEYWHPVTVGEFDKKKNIICVNLQALTHKKFSECAIVAHELGHFFAKEFNFDRKNEEIFACEFAEELIK